MNARLETTAAQLWAPSRLASPTSDHSAGPDEPNTNNMVHKLGWIAAALVCTAYIAYLFSLTPFHSGLSQSPGPAAQ